MDNSIEKTFGTYWKHFGSPASDVAFDCVRDDEARTIEITLTPAHLDTYLLMNFVRITLPEKGIDAIAWMGKLSAKRSRWQLIAIIGAYRHRVDVVEIYSPGKGQAFTIIVHPAEAA